jgi:hypothetical protein
MLPTPEYFNELVFAEIGHCKGLIDQIVITDRIAKVSVFRFGPKLKMEEVYKYIQRAFQFHTKIDATSLHDLSDAIMGFYSYPVEIEKLYKVHGWGLSWTEGEQLQICISLA